MKVFKMQARIARGGNDDRVSICDVVFINETPYVVFVWEGERPAVTAQVNPRIIQWNPGIPGLDAVYLQSVQDPRPLS